MAGRSRALVRDPQADSGPIAPGSWASAAFAEITYAVNRRIRV